MITDNFLSSANKYYSEDEKVTDLKGKVVTWTGTVVDSLSKSVVIYGGEDEAISGWDKQTNCTLPYIIFARFPDQVKDIEIGKEIVVKGIITSLGSQEPAGHWKLSECEIVEVNT